MAGCSSEEACVGGTCERKIACKDSRDCTGAPNDRGICDATTNNCVECVVTADCTGGRECDRETCVSVGAGGGSGGTLGTGGVPFGAGGAPFDTGGSNGSGGAGGVGGADSGGASTGGTPTTDAGSGCRPSDVIWVLDNSGSMLDEATGLQNDLAAMWSYLNDAGTNPRFVLISSMPGPNPGVPIPPYGVCAPAPFGSGNCTDDSNPPSYLHVIQEVDSHDALSQIEATYAIWKQNLRVAALKTVVVVSDDEANPTPSANGFASFMDGEFGASGWVFSGAFCSAVAANCANIGATYQTLVDRTGGVHVDLVTGLGGTQLQAILDGILARSDCQ